MNEELLKRHSAELVEHMTAYMEAVENLKSDEAKLRDMYQLPGGETRIGLDEALKNCQTMWLSAWGKQGTRNMNFVRQHAIQSTVGRTINQYAEKDAPTASTHQIQQMPDEEYREYLKTRETQIMSGEEFLDYLHKNTPSKEHKQTLR